jgi:hypothetical protein
MKLLPDTYLGADWLDKHDDPEQTARLIDQLYFIVEGDDILGIMEK